MENYSQSGPKMIPKWCQNGSRTVPGKVQMASEIEFGIGNASEATPTAKTWLILDPEAIKNRKIIDSETDFEFDCDFSQIFDGNFDQF